MELGISATADERLGLRMAYEGTTIWHVRETDGGNWSVMTWQGSGTLSEWNQPGSMICCRLCPSHSATMLQGNATHSFVYSFREVHNTISKIVLEVSSAIVAALVVEVISCPMTPQEWQVIAGVFAAKWQLPHDLGALWWQTRAHPVPGQKGGGGGGGGGGDVIFTQSFWCRSPQDGRLPLRCPSLQPQRAEERYQCRRHTLYQCCTPFQVMTRMYHSSW